jgi:fatty-acyl-CoA synthase
MHALWTDAFGWWAKARPDATALRLGDDALTYRQVDQWSDRIAADLGSRGVRVGDVVAIGGTNSLEWCLAALGCIKAGAVLAPFSFRFTPREIGVLVDDCSPQLVYADESQYPKLQDVLAGGGTFQLVALRDVRHLRSGPVSRFHPDRELDPSAPLAIIYTSGTTGRPKGVVYTHRTVLAFMTEILFKDPIPPEEFRLLFVLPLFTLGGTIYSLCQCLGRGGTFILTTGFSPREALDLLVRHRVSYMAAVPGIYEQIASLPGFKDVHLSHLKFASVGGARVSPTLVRTYHQRGVMLRHMYGMTEVGGYGSLPRTSDALAHPESCGDGSIFTKIKLIRPDGSETAPGEIGEILMRGPAMTPGYWRNRKATDELIVDGWIRSGDLGVRQENGLLRFVDRMKDMIISGGFNISPIEIENTIIEHAGVEEVAVIPVPDPRFGETPAAILYAKAQIDVPALIAELNGKLADYKVPRYVVQVAEPLPRMPSGKIARRALIEEYATIAERHPRVR